MARARKQSLRAWGSMMRHGVGHDVRGMFSCTYRHSLSTTAVAVLLGNTAQVSAGCKGRLWSLHSLCGITWFLSTQGKSAQRQMLLSANSIRPTKLGQWKDLRDEKEEEVGFHLSPASSWWCGDLVQRPSLVWPPFPHLQKWRDWSRSSLRAPPVLWNLFRNLFHEGLILKGESKGQRGGDWGERRKEAPLFLLWDSSQEVASLWVSVSFFLKSEGVSYLWYSFSSLRFYVSEDLETLESFLPDC